MTACSAAAPMMTSQVIENSLHVGSELAEQLDPIELSSLNELLDRIAALGVAMDYDRIGLKPDCRCQNRRISGRGSRTVRLRQMVIGGGDTMFTQVRALSMEVIPYFLLD